MANWIMVDDCCRVRPHTLGDFDFAGGGEVDAVVGPALDIWEGLADIDEGDSQRAGGLSDQGVVF